MSSCLMVEILSRLPVKSLMRFKCVCRPWDSLMREQYFINKYMENQRAKNGNGIIIGTGHLLGSFFSLHYTKGGGPIEYKCTVNRQNSGLSSHAKVGMSNSCNGLVCFFAERISFICNPATREYNVLPVGTADARRSEGLKDPFCYTGLGFGTSTGEYKVVRFFRIKEGYGCEAFTLGSHSWRRIENAPSGVICKPAFVNGRIHWDLYSGRGYDNPSAVVSFDVNTERFDLISYPEMQLQPWFCFMVQLGGHLCLGANYTEGLMDLWVLKDYGKSEWIKKFHINLTTISGFSRDIQCGIWPLTIWSGKLLMSFKLKLDLYDAVDGSFKQVMQSEDDDNIEWFCYEHVETLVSPSISPV